MRRSAPRTVLDPPCACGGLAPDAACIDVAGRGLCQHGVVSVRVDSFTCSLVAYWDAGLCWLETTKRTLAHAAPADCSPEWSAASDSSASPHRQSAATAAGRTRCAEAREKGALFVPVRTYFRVLSMLPQRSHTRRRCHKVAPRPTRARPGAAQLLDAALLAAICSAQWAATWP
jgi:hypothetical protein